MEEFWVLALLALLYQTGSASDTTQVIRAVGGSVTFRSPDTGGNAALWSFGDDPIVTVEFGDPPRPVFLKEEYQTRFTVSERGRALSITQLTINDAGTYSVTINGKTSTFILLVYSSVGKGKLAEPRVTYKAQDSSGVPLGSWIMIGIGMGIGIVMGIAIGVAAGVLLGFLVSFCKSKGYWPVKWGHIHERLI